VDYRVADGEAMTRILRDLHRDPQLRGSLVRHGLETIRARHTCGHRADELLTIVEQIAAPADMRLSA
jgi:spore maturation protein CgeB